VWIVPLLLSARQRENSAFSVLCAPSVRKSLNRPLHRYVKHCGQVTSEEPIEMPFDSRLTRRFAFDLAEPFARLNARPRRERQRYGAIHDSRLISVLRYCLSKTVCGTALSSFSRVRPAGLTAAYWLINRSTERTRKTANAIFLEDYSSFFRSKEAPTS
jgi:hypothetical protein